MRVTDQRDVCATTPKTGGPTILTAMVRDNLCAWMQLDDDE